MLLGLVAHSRAFREQCLRQRSTKVQTAFIEFWAGAGVLTKEHIRLGWTCSRFDRAYSNSHDCSIGVGLRLWVDELCQVSKGGYIWCGTQCSSFLQMCVSTSGRRRSNGFYGDESRKFVREGNRQMKVLSLLFVVASLLNVDVVLEQPSQSVLPHMQPLRLAMDFAGAMKTTTWLGEYGGISPKPIQLWHTASKFRALARRRRRGIQHGSRLVTRLPGNKFRGNPKALKLSQVYPCEFAVAVSILATTQDGTPRAGAPRGSRKRRMTPG